MASDRWAPRSLPASTSLKWRDAQGSFGTCCGLTYSPGLSSSVSRCLSSPGIVSPRLDCSSSVMVLDESYLGIATTFSLRQVAASAATVSSRSHTRRDSLRTFREYELSAELSW